MKINVNSELLSDISLVEEKYNAKYICETPIRGKQGWINGPCAIFYTETAHPEGSNYFALLIDCGRLVITNGISAVKKENGSPVIISGMVFDDGEIHYSRYRHDYRADDSGHMIDGGRDYVKASMHRTIPMIIDKDTLRPLTNFERELLETVDDLNSRLDIIKEASYNALETLKDLKRANDTI